jgi:hypothetical protein
LIQISFVSFFFTATFLLHAQTNAVSSGANSAPTIETLVCVRHGEKPKGGLGQLTCRGLNRALALPDVLLKKFGKPDFIFAPNPTQKVDKAQYYYVRPLVTIEPTAIRCEMPINTQFGYKEIDHLEAEFGKPEYKSALIFVAWEHGFLDTFVKNMVAHHGQDPKKVPAWPGADYDSIFIVKITHYADHDSLAFSIDHEGLDNLSDTCP